MIAILTVEKLLVVKMEKGTMIKVILTFKVSSFSANAFSKGVQLNQCHVDHHYLSYPSPIRILLERTEDVVMVNWFWLLVAQISSSH